MAARRASDDAFLTVGFMFALCAAVFYLNALFVGYRWSEFFDEVPDAPLLIAHSYLGAFAAASAVWALCSGDWTAVAFAAIMLSLAALGQKLKSVHLRLQYGVLGLLALFRVAVVNLHTGGSAIHPRPRAPYHTAHHRSGLLSHGLFHLEISGDQ